MREEKRRGKEKKSNSVVVNQTPTAHEAKWLDSSLEVIMRKTI